ncbi:MAG: hypothetical protein EXS14_01495 [Planctomycetes bacterium]|nr:hypothetical protein [Planctomycetota bacterium]
MNQYSVNAFWQGGSADPRVLMRGPGGRLFTGCGDGSVRILEDNDNNGVADNVITFVAGTWGPHGLAWKPNGIGYDLYVSHLTSPAGGTGMITMFTDVNGDDIFETVTTVMLNLPLGAHQVNNIKLDATGQWLYIAQGASSNTSAGSGALVARVASNAVNVPWGSPLVTIVGSGLRNPWGIEFHPSGALFATDNGRDDLGPTDPPDEFNHVVMGQNYGFPAVSGIPPSGNTTTGPIGLFAPHCSANGFAIDTGTMMTGFANQVFVAEWGSWNGIAPTPQGERIVQGNLHQRSNGSWVLNSWDFLTNCGHPLDVEIGAQGELFFSVQWASGTFVEGVYRVVPTHGIAVKLSGLPELGQSINVTVRSPSRPGHLYKVAASAGTGPIPTPLGGLGLSWDDLFLYSLTPNPWLNFAAVGVLNAAGVSNGPDVVNIPVLPILSGLTLYIAAATFDPVTVQPTAVSPTARLLIL